jgi:rare lipoprotein A
MAWCKIALEMMNDTHNKRYLRRLVVSGASLCVCLALGAQETMTQVIKDEKIGEIRTANTQTAETKTDATETYLAVGRASYYAAKFHGRRTASGERYNAKLMTAAHRTLPFGTQIKVTNLRNMKSVVVRVNDRGPHVHGRIVDLSRAAAQLIGINRTGVARVKLEILTK